MDTHARERVDTHAEEVREMGEQQTYIQIYVYNTHTIVHMLNFGPTFAGLVERLCLKLIKGEIRISSFN